MSDTLLIDTSDQASPFLHVDGQPVWPVRSAMELEALEEIASLFGASTARLPASPGTCGAEGSEEVVGLGDDVEPAGRLYAHLTRRGFRAARTLSELRAATPLAVVITTPAWLRSDLFNVLYNDCPGPAAPGIVCAPPDELRLQVLVRSAAAGLSGPVAARRVDIYPALQMGQLSVSDHLVFGGLDAALIRRVVRAGSGVLSIQTHSDGVDAMLASGLTLCPMDRMPIEASRDRTNRCVETGYCHRHYAPMEEILGSDVVVSPSEIRARVLVWDVCYGVMLADGVVDPQWSIGSRLLMHSALGSIITSWEIVFPQPRFLNMLASLIDQGACVGEAVHAFNRSPEATWFGQRMCLLGDPRVSLPAAPAGTAAIGSPGRQSAERRQSGWNSGHLEFIKILLTVAGSRPGDAAEPQARAVASAAEALTEYERIRMTPDAPSRADPGRRFREAVLDCVCLRGPLIVHDWGRYAQMRALRVDPPTRCAACARPHATLSSVLAQFEAPWIPERRISHCPYCGVVEDVPADTALQMSIEDGCSVRLSGDLPDEAWSGRLLVRPQLKHELAWWQWPATTEGRPVDVFRLPEPLPGGVLQTAVILMHEDRIMILAQFHRARR